MRTTGCSLVVALAMVVVASGPVSSVRAQCGGPFQLIASDGAAGDAFGQSVAVYRDVAVVGATKDDSWRGSAYVYRWDGAGWVQLAKLTASDGSENDFFGVSVAISGNVIVVGAASDDVGVNNGQGSAYVFVKPTGGWTNMTQTAKLTASDGAADDSLGGSVAISDNTIVVGALGGQGSTYVFVKPPAGWTNMTHTARLTASDGAASDRFGSSVAIAGDTVVVGAYGDDDLGNASGSAYVFVKPAGGWVTTTQTAKLTASDTVAADLFGWSVAISGDTIVVGSKNDDTRGSAYVFVQPPGGWTTMTQTARLTASDGDAGDQFGVSVSISGETIVVGADGDDVGMNGNQGSAYVFVKPDGNWADMTQTAKLTVSDGAADDYFGQPVAISGDTIVVGAANNDVGGNADQGSAHVFRRTGSTWVQSERTMLASDGAVSDAFGYAVAISGDVAVVGAANDDDVGFDQGSAYVYHWDGSEWVQVAKLTASDGATGDVFGVSVSISADTIVVGAYTDNVGANSQQGSAYVFVKPVGGWADMTQTAKLTASDGAAGDFFGCSIAISGDTIVVGATYDDVAGTDSGSAYVFLEPGGGWTDMTQTAKLMASDGAAGDFFGWGVAISGDTIVVGTPWDDVGANGDQGSAYVFVKAGAGWANMTQTAKLTASDGTGGDFFGLVSISGDTIVVGAVGDDDRGGDSGSAYVFVKPPSGWTAMTQTAKLTASDGAASNDFGRSVATWDDTIVVGARYGDGASVNQGSAYVFVKPAGGWANMTQAGKLTASDGVADDMFGWAVAISGETVVVGAYRDDVAAKFNQGSAHSFYVGHDCLSSVYNTTSASSLSSIAQAVAQAGNGDQLFATSGAFPIAGDIDYRGKAVDLSASGGIITPYRSIITLADGSSLATADGYEMTIYGQLRLPAGASADVSADGLLMGLDALLHARAGAALYLDVPASTLDGAVRLDGGATMSFTGSLTANGTLDALSDSTLWTDGNLSMNGPTTLLEASVFAGPITVTDELYCSDTAFSAPSMTISPGGRFIGCGTVQANVINSDRIYTVGDTLIVGDLLNNSGAVITIQIGTTTLIGTLTNDGTIVGEIQNPLMVLPTQADASEEGAPALAGASTAPGDGFFVQGDFVAGLDSSLSLPDAVWRVSIAGNYDVAVNSNTRYDMSQAELHMTGGAGAQSLELMSKDIGPDPQGLDRTLPAHFPIGTLRIASPAAVQLVDNHDNDGLGQSACEALYVSRLVIEAGATLHTNGCRLYYDSLINNGSVDEPSHLVPLCFLVIPGDFDGDCDVDLDDLAAFEDCASGPALSYTGDCHKADFDSDRDVDQSDFGVFQRCYSGEDKRADPNCAN